jgi:homopolymeric O-antigen transport system ATP-binding protein
VTTFAVSARGLGKRYRVGQIETAFVRAKRRLKGERTESIWALDDVSFDLSPGEAMGVIGRNGAGKSTLLKVLARITEPTTGYVDIAGRVGALLEVGTGFHPDLTGRENVYLNGTLLGMTRREIDRRFDDIVGFAGVERHINTPVRWYSSGMYVRLAFAVAAHLEPEILIVDEVLAVGDVEFQKRCISRMSDVTKEGRTILFVSHNMSIVRRLCQTAILLDSGRMKDWGPVNDVVSHYLSSIEPDEGGVRRWNRDDRLGDAAFAVTEIRVTGDDDEPKTTFFTSSPIYVTMEFEIEEDVSPALMAAFEIATGDGAIAFFSSFRDMPDGAEPPVVRGKNALRCRIPAELLNSGRYMINLRASLHGARWIVHEDSVLHFDVIASHGESLWVSGTGRPGAVAPMLEWEAVDPRAASEVPLHAA